MTGRSKDEDWAGDDAAIERWIARMLGELRDQPEPEFDLDATMARFHAAVRRMETDPEYAERIARIVEEVDAQLAAQEHEAERDGFDSHGVSGYEL